MILAYLITISNKHIFILNSFEPHAITLKYMHAKFFKIDSK